MDDSTSNDKTFPQTTQTKTPDCIEKACLPSTDLLKGRVVHVSFDCPENLRNSFNRETEANGTSTCHCLRGFMMAYVVASQSEKACLTNTIKSPVVIKKLVMPTYVKHRFRRLKPVEVTSGRDDADSGRCSFCRNASIGLFRYRKDGRVFLLCAFHCDEWVTRQGTWECVKNE